MFLDPSALPHLRRSAKSGFALIESVVALAILGIAGLALAETTAQALRLLKHTRVAETRVADMDRLMTAYTLLDRRDLGQRVGVHRVGSYQVRVERVEFDLFRVRIGAPQRGAELSTMLYRRDATRD